jgi:hypothetical protein
MNTQPYHREAQALPAVLGNQPHPKILNVCAWHSERIPGSTEDAEFYADSRGLAVSHGICPACKASMLRKIQHNGFTPAV